jgi:hypothetical protein
MKVTEILGFNQAQGTTKKYELIDGFQIWTTNEEQQLLAKLKEPIKLSNLSETEQFRIQAMIRKSLVTKIGQDDPKVVANEKIKS